jgi:hypothetical protein
MKKKYEKYTGTVSLNDNITPVSREPIEQIDATKWNVMDVNQLMEQKLFLYNRLYMAHQIKHPILIEQIENGIKYLEMMIQDKAEQKEELL